MFVSTIQAIEKDYINLFKTMTETSYVYKDLMDKRDDYSFVINLSLNLKEYCVDKREHDASQFDLSMQKWNVFAFLVIVELFFYQMLWQFDRCRNNDVKQASKDAIPYIVMILIKLEELALHLFKHLNINAPLRHCHMSGSTNSHNNIRDETIRLLVDPGADLSIKTDRDYTSSWEACSLGNFVVVQYLLKNMDTLRHDNVEYAFISLIKSINLSQYKKKTFGKGKAKTIDFDLGFNCRRESGMGLNLYVQIVQYIIERKC